MEGESVLSFGTIVLLSIWEAAKGMRSAHNASSQILRITMNPQMRPDSPSIPGLCIG